MFAAAWSTVSVSAQTGEKSLQRCEDLWFDDGNVILKAESTVFRVYRGILAVNSSVFKDMFSMPQPPSVAVEQMDGCSVVELPEAAADVEHFLKTIFIPGYYDTNSSLRNPGIIPAVLRLTTKYDARFRRNIIRQLSPVYPTTLEEWDKRKTLNMRYMAVIPMTSKIINLAQECQIRAFLPVAMYDYCRLSVHYILSGRSPTGVDLGISTSDRTICVMARQKITYDWRRIALAPIIGYRSDCQYPQSCPAVKLEWLCSSEVQKMVFGGYWCNPLGTRRPPIRAPYRPFCLACDAALERSFEEARKRIWRDLPSFFGLPGWDVLRAELERSLETV